jgi:hypothetical protein
MLKKQLWDERNSFVAGNQHLDMILKATMTSTPHLIIFMTNFDAKYFYANILILFL